ncbi:SAM-dependent methyltransferase [Phaeacidiphilus oryzae]|uniref:SAM-dependent methyltransferase n=1 Tax=Phaeacidiphilus oryzae TaxID=348818 RepID=UPI00068B5761|nr:SAM-dependent methyltransferase [Phaeacidiphilus oryzae]
MSSSSEPASVPGGVGRTALGVAVVRAQESAREDRLFDDPYAQAFVAAADRPPASPDPGSGAPRPPEDREARAAMARHIVLRTRFFDDYLLRAAADGIRQTVLLAAGLDTRAFRLDWPAGQQVFELDLPESIAFKERVLADLPDARPTARRAVVPADLNDDWTTPLTGAGFDPDRPTAWLIEGLLIYLGPERSAALLNTVGRLSAPGSRLALVRGGMRKTLAANRGADARAGRGASSLWRGGLGTDAADWLENRGWAVRRFDRPELEVAYAAARPEIASAGTTFLIAERAPRTAAAPARR